MPTLFQFNPLLVLYAALMLVGSLAGALLAALIAPLTRPTPLRRFGWRVLRVLFGLMALVALVGLYVAL